MKKSFPKRYGNSRLPYQVFILLGVLFLGSILFTLVYKQEGFENSSSEKSSTSSTGSKVSIEYFYMESCPYCVEFNDVWDKVTQDPKYAGMSFAKRNIKEDMELANKHNINSAPTVVAVDKKSGAIVSQFTDARDVAHFSNFVSRYT